MIVARQTDEFTVGVDESWICPQRGRRLVEPRSGCPVRSSPRHEKAIVEDALRAKLRKARIRGLESRWAPPRDSAFDAFNRVDLAR